MLKKFFDMENPLMQGLQTIAYLMMLNLLTILFSIPIVTAGAALTALYDVERDMVRHEETYPAAMFIHSFRKNLKAGITTGLLFIGALAVIAVDYFAAAAYIPPFRFLFAAAAVVLLALQFYAFALLARYDNTVRGTLKNAFLMMAGYFPRTAGMTLFAAVFYLLTLRYPTFSAPVLIMFGISLPGFVAQTLINPVFEKMEAGKD